jgi:MYXO-CTERM domain-containing protein
MRIQLFLLGLLVSGAALAAPDTFGLGTGRSGALNVQAPDTVINKYGQLTANAAAGTRDLTISSASDFNVGDLVLVHQSTGLVPAPASGDQSTLDLATNPVGRFEYARVESKGEASLRVTAPLQYSYAANVSQVVSVPEYTDVQVPTGTSLKAPPWDGSVGGILAFLATGTLTLDGVITADGAGFRGGAFIDHPGNYDCASLDEPAGNGGSYKGEGPVAGRFGTAAGRGNLSSGAGGGVCHNSGGGGGGHGGAGGKGGNTFTSTGTVSVVGGLGGARVSYQPYDHILFGGGGGGGGGHVSTGTNGGAGGGVMLIRADIVDGTGQFSAKGTSAAFVPSATDDGAGGGGAGGAISVRAAHGLKCGLARAPGGIGGDTHHTTYASGPGGGGGGGVVFLQAESFTCPVSVVAGYSGQSTAAKDAFGAEPSVIDISGSAYGSEVTYLIPFQTPATPVLTEPANGATGLPLRPRIQGIADPGVIVHIYLDGVRVGQVVTGTAGDFQYTPFANLTVGTHQVQASAEVFNAYSLPSGVHAFGVGTGGDGGVPDGGLPDGGLSEAAPILVVPGAGEEVDPLPLFAGMSPSGASVSIEVDGAEVARVSLDDQRRFRYMLTAEQRLAPGAHGAVVRAWDESGGAGLSSAPTGFEVKAPTELEAGCGCGSSQGAGLGAVALLLGLGAARLRRRE